MLRVSVWETVRTEYLKEKRERPSRTVVTSALDLLRIVPWAEVCFPETSVCPGFPHVSPTLSLPGAWHMASARKLLPQEHSISHLSLSQEHHESETCFQTVLTELCGSSQPCPHRSSTQRSSVSSARGCFQCWSRDQLKRTQDLPLCPKFQWESRQPPERQIGSKCQEEKHGSVWTESHRGGCPGESRGCLC